MKKEPFFSIIIPVHNVASYLRGCLDSLIAQTFGDWEAVCVDDGSTDGSAAILDAYANKDQRIRVVHKRQEGVSIARNVALAVTNGRYIAFADGDDAMADEWLSNAHLLSCRYDADLVRQRFMLWNDGEPRPEPHAEGTVETVGLTGLFEWGWKNFLTSGHLWRCFIRRNCIDGLSFSKDLAVREDCIFLLSLLPRLRVVVQGNFAGYFYRLRTASAWHAYRRVTDAVCFPEKCKAILDVQRKAICPTPSVPESYSIALVNNLVEWLERSNPKSRKAENYRVVAATRSAMKCEGMHTSGIHLRWKLALWWLNATGRLEMTFVAMFLQKAELVAIRFVKQIVKAAK